MGLLRTAVRASVATRVVGSTHRRQQQRWAAQDAAVVAANQPGYVPTPAAPPSGGPASPMLDQLSQLGALRDSGVLTPAEFEAQKQRILAGG